MKTRRLVLFGDSAFAEIAYEYFTHDSEYEVAGFTVSRAYLTSETKFGLPVVPFEDVTEAFPPSTHEMHIALIYNRLNRNRIRFYTEAKSRGYKLANYISSRAFVWRNVELGDNVFIFEDNTVQPFVKMGSNLVLWSGNHIGHHSIIEGHTFFSSHVVISGFCRIGEACFFGVNSTVAQAVTIARDCLIGAGSLVVKDLPAGALLRGPMTKPEPNITTWEKFGLTDSER